MPQAVAAVSLIVRDYDEAIHYFTLALRFTLVEDTPLTPGKRWVVVHPPGGGTALLLAKAATPEQAARVGDQTGGRVFLFLHTDDFHRDYHDLTARGVRFTEPPREEPYGTVAVFLDLYGNKWDLVQPRTPGVTDSPRRELLRVPGAFAVCRLPAGSPIPAWATSGEVFSVTRTSDELSVVCEEHLVPPGTQSEGGWNCLRVAGAMSFSTVGVLASLTGPVAAAGVSVFAVSTFDTDYLLVKAADLPAAVDALRGAGHTVAGEQPK